MPPLRGIVACRNEHLVARDLTTLRKWIRLNRVVFKVEKIDLLMGPDELNMWPALAAFAETEGILLSLRIASSASPGLLQAAMGRNLLDVCLEHASPDAEPLLAWMAALEEADLSARVVLCGPWHRMGEDQALRDALARAASVAVAAYDPFIEAEHANTPEQSAETVRRMNALTRDLNGRGVDVSMVGLPFCLVEEDNLSCALNRRQFFLDHQFYHRQSYIFAERMHRFGAGRVSMAAENLLARKTSVHHLIDAALFPWIQDYPRLYIRTWMYHKLTRHIWFLRTDPRPLPETLEPLEHEIGRRQARRQRRLGPVCGQCRYRRACDRVPDALQRCLPGLAVKAQEGEVLAAVPANVLPRKRRYDALDEARLALPARLEALAEHTRHVLTRVAPTREISADAYDIAGRFTHHMPGAVRWLSFGKVEPESTVLARLEPPFTLSFTLGGGIAAHAGFSFGRHAKIVCPMIDYSHRITLGVDADGAYVLLRDGQMVRPTEFEGVSHVPPRLGGVLEPRLSLHNIDGMILTQTVLLWQDGVSAPALAESVKYSIIIISTRYTRRLQAALLAIAHQRGISRGLIEIVIGYVPGIDATDDLIDGIEAAFPDLRIVRSPFSESHMRSKGFMINESLRSCSGKWVLLLDADIVLPPHTMETLETVEEGKHFIAPEGRKMLPPDVTGKILLNELRPWESFDDIMNGPGEVRKREADGIPIGFFQCVRRQVLARIPYHELDHFEASDWIFGRDVTVNYGREYRLKDFYALHLDHGGSQWYGTHKHR